MVLNTGQTGREIKGNWFAGTPGLLMREGHQDIHVVDGKEARLAVDHPFVPVVVDLVGEGDDVALFEAQFAVVLGFEVIERSAAGLVHGR